MRRCTDPTFAPTVLYAVSDEVPTADAQWIFAMNSSKTVVDVEIPNSVAAGAKVWLTAMWFNAKKQTSPAAVPEFARISDGWAAEAA